MNQVKAVSSEQSKFGKRTKRWWEVAKKIKGRKAQGTSVSSVLSLNEINSYFQLINTDNNAYKAPVPVEPPSGTRIPSVDEHLVRNLLLPQKRTAPGPDEFPYWLWRDYADFLAPVIINIFINSLRHQTVPSLWKLANVTPVPKESPLNECNQLRPISLTDIVMRIFERVVCKQELSLILKPSICTDQFAFKEELNTTMALIKCQHHRLNWLDKYVDFV